MTIFEGYTPHPYKLRNPLLQNAQSLHGAPPTTEELLALQEELIGIKTKTSQRLNKATADLGYFQSKWAIATKGRERPKETTERPRHKQAKERIKRESSETPSVDEFVVPDVRSRHTSTNIRKSDADRNADRKKKRKRDDKRESIDPDIEMLDGTSRHSPSPAIIPVERERPPKKPKHNAYVAQLTLPPPPPGPPVDPDVATDFTLPAPPVLNLNPTLGLWGKGGLLQPTPSKAYEVSENFLDVKAPAPQAQVHTFWKEAESWLKNAGEEDVTWLRYSTDDSEVFNLPKLGRHYSEVWEEEARTVLMQEQSIFQSDPSLVPNGASYQFGQPGPSAPLGGAVPTSPTKPGALPGSFAPPAPDILTDADLATQKKSLGPLTERVLSALLVDEKEGILEAARALRDEDANAAGPSNAANPNTNAVTNPSASTISPAPVSFYDMETRLKLELKACGLLGVEEPDFSESYDDPIAASLRSLQRQLRRVKQLNDARKERLSSIARDRLSYTDYLDLLEDLNRQITAGYQRILRANQKAQAATKKKKVQPGSGMSERDKDKERERNEALAEAARLKTLVLDVPENLVKLIDIRRQFKDAIGRAMQEWENRDPGHLINFPQTSIYDGLKPPADGEWDDDVIQEVEVNIPPS